MASRLPSAFAQRVAKNPGLSLVEMVVVVAILGIASAIAIPSFAFVLRRERVNAVALEVAGWLEEVRNLSARQVDPSATAGGCAVSLVSTATALAPGGTIGTVASVCNPRNPVLRIPDVQGASFDIRTISPGGAGGTTPEGDNDEADGGSGLPSGANDEMTAVVFTPRGMWTSVPPAEGDLEVRIRLSDGSGPMRCVRMSSILGSIDIGSDASSNLEAPCSRYEAL